MSLAHVSFVDDPGPAPPRRASRQSFNRTQTNASQRSSFNSYYRHSITSVSSRRSSYAKDDSFKQQETPTDDASVSQEVKKTRDLQTKSWHLYDRSPADKRESVLNSMMAKAKNLGGALGVGTFPSAAIAEKASQYNAGLDKCYKGENEQVADAQFDGRKCDINLSLAPVLDELFADMGRQIVVVRIGHRCSLRLLVGMTRIVEVKLTRAQDDTADVSVQIECEPDPEHATDERLGAPRFDLGVATSQKAAENYTFLARSIDASSHMMRVDSDSNSLFLSFESKRETAYVSLYVRIVAGQAVAAGAATGNAARPGNQGEEQASVSSSSEDESPTHRRVGLSSKVGRRLDAKLRLAIKRKGTSATEKDNPHEYKKSLFQRSCVCSDRDISGVSLTTAVRPDADSYRLQKLAMLGGEFRIAGTSSDATLTSGEIVDWHSTFVSAETSGGARLREFGEEDKHTSLAQKMQVGRTEQRSLEIPQDTEPKELRLERLRQRRRVRDRVVDPQRRELVRHSDIAAQKRYGEWMTRGNGPPESKQAKQDMQPYFESLVAIGHPVQTPQSSPHTPRTPWPAAAETHDADAALQEEAIPKALAKPSTNGPPRTADDVGKLVLQCDVLGTILGEMSMVGSSSKELMSMDQIRIARIIEKSPAPSHRIMRRTM